MQIPRFDPVHHSPTHPRKHGRTHERAHSLYTHLSLLLTPFTPPLSPTHRVTTQVWFAVIVLLGLHVVGFFIWLLLCGSQKIDDARQFQEFKQSKKEL